MLHVSLFAAFIAGVVSVLPACGPALLPAFFAYSFAQPKRLFAAVLCFMTGFGLVFIPFAFGLSWLVGLLTLEHSTVLRIVGIGLIGFGILSLFGARSPWRYTARGRNFISVFTLGVLFGLTAASCSAPVLGAIITLAASSLEPVYTLFLLLTFVVGMGIPLVVVGLIMQYIAPKRISKVLSGGLELTLGTRTFKFYWGNLLAAILFIGLGVLYIQNQPTAWLRIVDTGWLQDMFFNINMRLLK